MSLFVLICEIKKVAPPAKQRGLAKPRKNHEPFYVFAFLQNQ